MTQENRNLNDSELEGLHGGCATPTHPLAISPCGASWYENFRTRRNAAKNLTTTFGVAVEVPETTLTEGGLRR